VDVLKLVLLVAPVAVVVAVLRHRRTGSATLTVVADDGGVRRTLADGRTEAVSWEEVVEVDVFVARVGPYRRSGGAVVLYGDERRGCVVPLDQLGPSGLLGQVWRLPGFDVRVLVEAAAAGTEPARTGGDRGAPGSLAALSPRPLQRTTVCWTRGGREPD
jgi:hypothetical protein